MDTNLFQVKNHTLLVLVKRNKDFMKKNKEDLYSKIAQTSDSYDLTTDFDHESDYNMYSNEDHSECDTDHIHVGPLIIEFCQHDEGSHVCVYVKETGEKIAETEISDHGMEDHMSVIGENMEQIHKSYMEKAEMEKSDKPFHGYNKKKHAKTGGLNDKERKRINREEGRNLKRPQPEGGARKRSFCARMSGVKGPTSKDGKLTPKGAALKRWKCSKSEDMNKGPSKIKAGIAALGIALTPHAFDKIKDHYNNQKNPEKIAFEQASDKRKQAIVQHFNLKPKQEWQQSFGYDYDPVAGRHTNRPQMKLVHTSAEDQITPEHEAEFDKKTSKPAGIYQKSINKSEKLKQFMSKVESKKQLEHYSPQEGLQNIDPSYKQTGVDRGAKGRDTEHPHSFYYVAGTEPEHIVASGASSKYTVELPEEASVYDISQDPMDYAKQVRQNNNGAFNMDMMHQLIKEGGHHGFTASQHPNEQIRNVVALYHSQPVKKETKLR